MLIAEPHITIDLMPLSHVIDRRPNGELTMKAVSGSWAMGRTEFHTMERSYVIIRCLFSTAMFCGPFGTSSHSSVKSNTNNVEIEIIEDMSRSPGVRKGNVFTSPPQSYSSRSHVATITMLLYQFIPLRRRQRVRLSRRSCIMSVLSP